jgi:hypothetical protein
VSCSLYSGISGFGSGSSGVCAGISGGSNCMGSGSMVCDGMSVYCCDDWGCGGDGGCPMMMVVDGVVLGSSSSWISIIWVARPTEKVRGTVDEMGWGFKTLLGDIPVLGFLSIGSVMNTMLRISLTSLPVNIACSGSCRNMGNVLFLCSNGFISSFSSESICTGASFFCTSRPKLSPNPAS